MLTSFNGLVDDIRIWDEAIAESTIASWKPENEADLSVAESRFAGDPLRPASHGMPGANWTNETHGMTYSNGRFHVFFQKNANGRICRACIGGTFRARISMTGRRRRLPSLRVLHSI